MSEYRRRPTGNRRGRFRRPNSDSRATQNSPKGMIASIKGWFSKLFKKKSTPSKYNNSPARSQSNTGTNSPRPAATPRPEIIPTEVTSARLYVGNLSYESTWQSLKDHFKNSGNVTRADVQQDNDGRSKGYGFVEFTNPHEAASAYAQLNNSYLDGRQIFVREDREEGK